MSLYHVVAQGEYVSAIARRYGFSDYRTVWDAPENAALKAERKTPNVLFPGDRLFIPDRHLREEPRPTDQRHRFVRLGQGLVLRVRMEHRFYRPIATTPCDLTIESRRAAVTTDDTGQIQESIEPGTSAASVSVHERLRIRDANVPVDLGVELMVGHLDPVEEPSGQVARLHNLGYYRGPAAAPDAKLVQAAIEEFQCEHGLGVDGVCGPRTQSKLREVHGC